MDLHEDGGAGAAGDGGRLGANTYCHDGHGEVELHELACKSQLQHKLKIVAVAAAGAHLLERYCILHPDGMHQSIDHFAALLPRNWRLGQINLAIWQLAVAGPDAVACLTEGGGDASHDNAAAAGTAPDDVDYGGRRRRLGPVRLFAIGDGDHAPTSSHALGGHDWRKTDDGVADGDVHRGWQPQLQRRRLLL